MNSSENQVALSPLSVTAGFGWVRPKTRGEMRDAINSGKTCEIPNVGVEMTTIMLKHWLNCADFTVEKSTNDGWVLFLPNASGEPMPAASKSIS